MSEKPLYNSALMNNYIELLKAEYTHINISDILDEAGINAWELDPGNWFTQSQVNKFNKILLARTGNTNFPREAGRFSVAYRADNLMRQAALSLMSPSNLYDILGKISAKYTKAADVTVNKISPHKYEIINDWRKDANPEPFQCESTIGYYEAVYFVFRSKFPRVEHSECIFKGGKRCRYIISWEKTKSESTTRLRNLVSLVWALVLIVMLISGHDFNPIHIAALVFFFLTATVVSMMFEKKDLMRIVSKQDFKPYDVLESYSYYHKSTNLIKKVSVALSKTKTVEDFMDTVGKIYLSFGYHTGIIVLIDYSKNKPVYGDTYHFDGDDKAFINKFRGKSAEFVRLKKDLSNPIIENREKLSLSFPKDLIELLKDCSFDSIVYIPVIYEKALLGLIFIKNVKTSIKASDLYILHSVASQSALSITNISFYESLLVSEKVKRDFITVASHELITPVQTINLASQDIKNTLSNFKIYDSGLLDSIDILDQSAYKLGVISKNILNFKKLEADKSLQTISLDQIAESVRKESAYIVKTFSHTLVLELNDSVETVKCNRDSFIQLLCNLVENAAKYTPPGGTIIVSFDISSVELTVSVEDNGIGVNKEFHDKIFMKFYQVDDSHDGTGLGLSFCQEVAKKHEGYISVESPLNAGEEIRKGTKMTFHLPLNIAEIDNAEYF